MVLATLGGAVPAAVAAPASASTKPPVLTAATRAKIVANWDAFFSGSTPAARKIALVQNGSSFAAVIKGQAGNPLSKSVTAKVSKVTLTSATVASVKYSLDLGGQPALSNVVGKAVLQKGTWKVGDQSFCALLALEQTKVPACSSAH